LIFLSFSLFYFSVFILLSFSLPLQNQYFSSIVSGEEVLVGDAPGSSAPVRGTSTPLRGKFQIQLADEIICHFFLDYKRYDRKSFLCSDHTYLSFFFVLTSPIKQLLCLKQCFSYLDLHDLSQILIRMLVFLAAFLSDRNRYAQCLFIC
jgi:hypothetical protein